MCKMEQVMYPMNPSLCISVTRRKEAKCEVQSSIAGGTMRKVVMVAEIIQDFQTIIQKQEKQD